MIPVKHGSVICCTLLCRTTICLLADITDKTCKHHHAIHIIIRCHLFSRIVQPNADNVKRISSTHIWNPSIRVINDGRNFAATEEEESH